MTQDPSLQMIITTREKDLGGFSVRRILPYASHRMVGPFIFFDHMGPAVLPPGEAMNVRPHPHIHLATVTYLFEGKIEHRDSLGSDLVIEPGAINWMTAGRGIVHSERTPPDAIKTGSKMHGIQLWVALPEEYEEIEPTFVHHPKDTLPEFEIESVKLKLLLGQAFGKKSPVKVHSDLFYAEAKMPKGAKLKIASEGRELAFYVVTGSVTVGKQMIETQSMAVGESGHDLMLHAKEDSHLMIIGGKSVGTRNIYWNFVSSKKEAIEEAKKDWALGPRKDSRRFHPVPGDDKEFIPLPVEPGNPKGTIL